MSAKYTFLAWDTPIENAPLKLALLQLANNADDNGFSYYSISKMAVACGMSEKTFQRKIQEMEKMGILTVGRRANRPSLYTLVGDEMGVTLCPLQISGGTESRLGGTESRLVSDRESPDLNNTPNNNPNNSVCQLKIIKEDGFNYWYKAYPKKVAKPDAEKAFKAATKKMKEDEFMEFVDFISSDSIKRYKETDKQFMPAPAKYIRQELYNDE
jgi:AraC-like DNA-binding protein